MWKKLTLLAAVAGAVAQVTRYLRERDQGKAQRDTRRAEERWEAEGGSGPAAPTAARSAPRTRKPRTVSPSV
jgi:hypothetical protein